MGRGTRFGSWAAACAVALGCGGSSDDGRGSTATAGIDPGTGSGSGPTSGSPNTSGLDDDSGGMQATVVSIEIQPAMAQIEILDGVVPAATDFEAIATYENGTTAPITGTWTFDRPDLADIVNTGELTATGLAGGIGTVSIAAEGLTADATATIKIHITDDSGVDPGILPDFDTTNTPDPALAWMYPYDATVFPRGLRGPTLQWQGGADTDVYYVHAESPTFEYEYWGTIANPSRFDFPQAPNDVWRILTDSVSGPITVGLQRHDGTQAYLPASETWTIADAVLTGTVYYWEVNNGNVVRLPTGADAPEPFLQNPPGVTCVACHSVSKDGSTIVASFEGGASPWGTFEAATGASILATGTSSGFQAISPNGSHVLTRHWTDGAFSSLGELTLSLSGDQTPLAQLVPPPGSGSPGHPAWSTDGNQVAFSMRTDGNGLDFNSSSLWISDVDLVTPGFSNIMQIVANDATRPTVTYPTFSPDSAWIAFMRATQARTRGAQGEVWLTSNDGATQIPLDRANGVGIISQTDANYEPTFLPVSLGGYFWLVFVSERTYGNTLLDTNVNTRFKQLWVTAIDASPQAGVDPSHPAFWLPGQELNNQNMRGEWALNPCLELGESCESGFECCEGFCQPDDNGNFVCSPPGECAQLGEACDTNADCCDESLACIGGYCAPYVPG